MHFTRDDSTPPHQPFAATAARFPAPAAHGKLPVGERQQTLLSIFLLWPYLQPTTTKALKLRPRVLPGARGLLAIEPDFLLAPHLDEQLRVRHGHLQHALHLMSKGHLFEVADLQVHGAFRDRPPLSVEKKSLRRKPSALESCCTPGFINQADSNGQAYHRTNSSYTIRHIY